MARPKNHKEQKIEEEVSAYVVIAPFRDKDNFSIAYKIGDDVSHFEEERLQYTIEKGLVEKK